MESLNKLADDWKDLKKIIVYGFGRVAQRNIGKLKADFDIECIIDNSPALKIYNYEGIPVQKFENVKEMIKNLAEGTKVIVPTSTLAYESISGDLSGIGLTEYQDYCRLEDFLPEWYWKYKGQVCVSQIFSAITSRCTFNCKFCSMLMPYYQEQYVYTVDEVLADFELLFGKIDYLTSYYIIGGEPFVNKDLAAILEQVYDRYNDKIGYMQVITNGSIVPDEELLRVFKKCGVNIRVSDYTHAIHYERKFKEVLDCLEQNGIDYSVSAYESWMNLGYPEEVLSMGNTCEELRSHMLNCAKGCHSMNEKKLYYCGLLFAAEKLGLYKLKENDYIDLEKTVGNAKRDKEKILRYFLGDVEDGYISLCRYCRGQGTDNPVVIPVAEQTPRIKDKILETEL